LLEPSGSPLAAAFRGNRAEPGGFLRPPATSPEVSVGLSESGTLFNKLKQLAESDPEKFKTVMTDIADEIEKAAESSADDQESCMLKKVAERFRKAGESGESSAAFPPGPPPAGPPPASAADSTTEGRSNAYTQTQKAGSDGFRTVLIIIHEVLDENTMS
jgi:hypothetical protein